MGNTKRCWNRKLQVRANKTIRTIKIMIVTILIEKIISAIEEG